MFKFPILQNDLFVGIMGWKEYLSYSKTILDRSGMVLISITEPDEKSLSLGQLVAQKNENYVDGYDDVLEVQFWDVREYTEQYPTIPDEIGDKIRDFILSNKEKKFLVHCRAGKSRSAGVAKAIECLVKFDGNVHNYLQYSSPLDLFERYTPNMTVFHSICR